MKKILLVLPLAFLLGALSTVAQTTIISPTGDGGFETGADFPANGWTVANYSSNNTNKWFVGTVASGVSAGTRGAFISSNASGTTHDYTITGISRVMFWRDVTFPAGETNITLSYKVKVSGESTWDDVSVFIQNGSTVPSVAQPASSSSSDPSITNTTRLATWSIQTAGAFVTKSHTISSSDAGNASATTVRRLIFYWENDGSGGVQPPAALDEISLVSAPTPGDNCSNAINLSNLTSPYSSTTAGAGADFTNTCASGNGSPDLVFYIDVPNGQQLTIGQTVNGYDSEHIVSYGSTCPSTSTSQSTNPIACADDPDIANVVWTNSTGSTQRVWWVQDGYSSTPVSGTFTLAWSLTTPPAAPNCATLNTPTNGATGVALNTPLTWTAAGSGGNPTGYKVYLGTVNPPTTLVSTVTAPTTTYTPSGQTYSTTYYWYIVPTNATGDATGCNGTVFSYVTQAPPAAPANDLCINAINVLQAANTTQTYLGTNLAATASSPTLPACSNSSAGVDVWYAFTPSAGGTLDIDIQADGTSGTTSFDSQIQVFSGPSCPNSLSSCVAASDDGTSLIGDSNDPGVSVTVTTGTRYFIRVYNWASSGTGAFNMRIITPAGVALPLELLSFTGKTLPSTNQLNWATGEERNVATQIVERSIDGAQWVEIGQVAAKGSNSTYQLEDRTPLAKTYYRLRVLDNDGSEQLSNVLILSRRDKGFGITAAFPSPTADFVTVQFNTPEEQRVTLRVTDFTGRIVLEQSFDSVKDANAVSLSLANLPAGTYVVTVSNANAVAEPVKVVKQ